MNEHWEVINAGSVKVSNTPEELWENAIAYLTWCKENPITFKRTLTSGKEAGKQVEIEAPRALHMTALCLHCGISVEYFNDLLMSKDGSLYSIVASRIDAVMQSYNLEMAIVEVFNPIIVSKMIDFGASKADNNKPISVTILEGTPKLANSESEIIKQLEDEIEGS